VNDAVGVANSNLTKLRLVGLEGRHSLRLAANFAKLVDLLRRLWSSSA
jgi:hypothetical protein